MCLLYFSFLTQSTTLYPGDNATQSGLGLPKSTNLIKTISNRYTGQPSEDSLSLSFLGDSLQHRQLVRAMVVSVGLSEI